MKRLSVPLQLGFVILVITLLVACAPGEQLPSAEEIEAAISTYVVQTMEAQGEIATSVAETIAVQNTQTAMAIPSQTDTPAAAAIFEPAAIPTDTPIVPDLPSPTFPPPPTDPLPAIATITPKVYACDAFTQSPPFNSDVKPGEKFDVRWIIVNTGTKAWRAGIDVNYSGGQQMTTTTSVEIPNALQPRESYTIVLDAVAPKQQGMQYMTWTVEGQLCFPTVAINVTK